MHPSDPFGRETQNAPRHEKPRKRRMMRRASYEARRGNEKTSFLLFRYNKRCVTTKERNAMTDNTLKKTRRTHISPARQGARRAGYGGCERAGRRSLPRRQDVPRPRGQEGCETRQEVLRGCGTRPQRARRGLDDARERHVAVACGERVRGGDGEGLGPGSSAKRDIGRAERRPGRATARPTAMTSSPSRSSVPASRTRSPCT